MKKGDIIRCHDQKDLRHTMKDLSAAGFHAVKDRGWAAPRYAWEGRCMALAQH